MRALAVRVELGRRLRVRERMLVIELGERGVGGLEACTEHAALIGAAKLVRPDRVGLVFEHLTAHQRERLLERAPSHGGRLTRRPLDQLVEAVEVELDEVLCEAVRLRLGDDEPACTVAVVGEMPSEDGDEGLDGAADVLWPAVAPEKLGDPLGRHAMPACREQDLEHLLRPRSSEVAGTERSRDRRRSRALRRAGSSGGRKIGLLP